MVYNIGILVGGFGINIGHELGHRNKAFEQNLSKLLLLPALYQHFFIEHNRGHHKNVATDLDPASSRYGENLYAFWWRSVTGSYMSAWHIENEQMKRENKPVLSWANGMIRFHVYQAAYLIGIGLVFSGPSVLMAIAFGIFGFLLLETVNYIEHYGLRIFLPSASSRAVRPGRTVWQRSRLRPGRCPLTLPNRRGTHTTSSP